MDDEVVQRVFLESGTDYFQQQPSSAAASSSILQSLSLHASFDRGYDLLVKSIQELWVKKESPVTVGIGGPSGSWKTSLAEKVALVIGCTVISMENYRIGVEEGNDSETIHFDALVRNLEDLSQGRDTSIPLSGFQQKRSIPSKRVETAPIDSGFSLHALQGNEVLIDNFIEMCLRPSSASEEARITDWIKVRQSGIRCYLSLGDQWIVDKNFIIRPKAEFEAVGTEVLRIGITGPWITISYLEMILERKGVPCLSTPPLSSSSPGTGIQETAIAAPKPIPVNHVLVTQLDDLSQPWTRPRTKSKLEPLVETWHFVSSHSSRANRHSFRDTVKLAPMPDSYDLDRGLLLLVQCIQALLENKGPPIIVGIGGPSGSGKTTLAHKMQILLVV